MSQRDVPGLMGFKGLSALRARAVVRGSRIEERRIVVPPDDLRELTTIEDRNAVFREHAPRLAAEACVQVVRGRPDDASALVTSSCTGYMVPSLAVELVGRLGLCGDVARLPITEAGCSGGVVAIARAADYLAAHPGASAVAAAVELCSLSFHQSEDEGVLTANLIFGDGAGAALLESGDGPGIEVVDSSSYLVPGSRHMLGFDLTNEGFYPVLSRELVQALPVPTMQAAASLLARHGLRSSDVSAWLLHPGGSRILSRLESEMGLERSQTRWSWESLREFGNTSSAAIFDVLRRYLDDARAAEWGVVAAFGPGVAVELLLVRREC
ncbi:MAG: 3-oxoacyl-[acyl-carrier-protein] synthase III C-terminal domain-containing protein [Dehalococcoidia bacterium]